MKIARASAQKKKEETTNNNRKTSLESFCGLQLLQVHPRNEIPQSPPQPISGRSLAPCVMSANKTHGTQKKQIGSAVYASVGSALGPGLRAVGRAS